MSAKKPIKPEIKPPASGGKKTTVSWSMMGIVLAIAALLLYANTLGHDYTVDDTTVIKNNKFTTQGIAGLDEIFSSSYRAGFWDRKEGLYRPLSVAMFAIEWSIAPENPFPGHLINVLIYALIAIILLSLLKDLLRDLHPLIPIAVTALWLFHPLHTEVVANIKSRDELLSFLFGILSLSTLFRSICEEKISFVVLSGFYFFLALLAKESSVTWAGVIPLALWCFTKADTKKIIGYSAVYIGIIGVFFVLRIATIGEIAGGYELMLINNSLVGATDITSRFATALLIMGKYLWLFVFPKTLVFDYSYNTIPLAGLSHPGALISAVVLIGGLIYALKELPKRSVASFGILFFFGTVVLVSNIFFLIEATMAERFVFTPSLGLCLLTGFFMNRFLPATGSKQEGITLSDIRNTKLFLPLTLILVLFAGRTISRNADWKNNLTLLQHDVKVSPESARIRYALGSTLLVEEALKAPEGSTERINLLDRSIAELSKGVSILPNYNDAWYHLGIAYKERGDAANAVKAFETARGYKPFTEASRLVSAGVAYGMNKQYDKAISDLKAATQMDPGDADAWNNYGLYLSESGKINESLEALTKSISLKPTFDKAYYNRGNTYAKAGDFRSALKEYGLALSINPVYTDALNNSGNCYVMLQRPDSALSFFERSVQADPGNVKAVMNLAVTLQNLGDTAKAAIYFNKARSMGAGI